MDTFKVADFAFSIFTHTAAGAVFQTFGTVFHADKLMFRQAAVLTSPAGCQNFFHQPVTGGTVTMGVGKEHFPQFLTDALLAGDGKFARIIPGRRFFKRIIPAQYPVVKPIIVQRIGHLHARLMLIVFIKPVIETFELRQS